MPDNINVEISTKKPVVAANLTELRYLVFQGMTGDTGQSAYALAVELGFEGTEEEWLASLVGPEGPAGAPGTTLGWDVTDDGAGNVEMTYPEDQTGDSNAVRFVQQTLTTAQQTQARANIGAASAAAVNDLNDDVIALETITDEHESSDSVLEPVARAKGADATAAGMDFAKNDDGSFSIYGINTTNNNAIFYTSAASVTAAGAPKPPAGVYRLEISADQAADFTDVYGVLYIGNSSHYVITDAVGKSVEVYLDGETSVSDGIVVSPGKNANGLNITIALRRVGTPELGELLVDQINQMQALQRKTLSMLDTLRSAYAVTNNIDAGVYTIPRVMDIVDPADLNSIGKVYCVTLVRYNSSTLHSPYSEEVTARNSGLVLDFHGGANIGIQIGFPAGDEIICARKLYQGAFGGWVAIGGATSGT